jgi:hypothetical protein
VKVTTPPFLHRQPIDSTNTVLARPDQVPWIGTLVILNKVGHPMKGYSAIVTNVLCGQKTLSGLQIVARFTHMDPTAPFTTVVVDYDDVVEAKYVEFRDSFYLAIMGKHRTKCKLFDYWKPTSELFKPLPAHRALFPEGDPHQMTPSSTSGAPSSQTMASSTLSSATPLPTSVSESSPAWDPLSRTPNPYLEDERRVATDSCHQVASSSTAPPEPSHPLLDSRLCGRKLKVVANGRDYKSKELTVSVEMVAGSLSIRHVCYNVSRALPPEWISPKHPNPTRDNGLLVVIKGEHCGKHVRRIHHRYESGKAVINLAVVDRIEGSADILVGERLELDTSYLCLGSETAEERKRNDTLMTSLRQEARKVRAK